MRADFSRKSLQYHPSLFRLTYTLWLCSPGRCLFSGVFLLVETAHTSHVTLQITEFLPHLFVYPNIFCYFCRPKKGTYVRREETCQPSYTHHRYSVPSTPAASAYRWASTSCLPTARCALSTASIANAGSTATSAPPFRAPPDRR